MTSATAPMVFIVDDDDLVRASIQGMLKSVGLHSETFGTAQSFLQSKRTDGPSCLVLDVRLPGVDGLDFSANWLPPASEFLSSSLPAMAIFR